MSAEDAARWDRRYEQMPPPDSAKIDLPFAVFSDLEPRLVRAGRALELACGTGHGSVWLAERGLDVLGVDISAVAIDQARALACEREVDDRCRFEVHDLDDGLPATDQLDLVVCHRFNDPALDSAILERLSPGGSLAIAVLSEVGAEPGRFRSPPGALFERFRTLESIERGEGNGLAWLLARKQTRTTD